MVEQDCHFCGRETATAPDMTFCPECTVNSCPQCNQTLSFYSTEDHLNRGWRCPERHYFDVSEMIEHLHKKRLYEFSKFNQIKFAGPRVEAIIPDSNSISGIALDPADLDASSNELVLYHGTMEDNIPVIMDAGRLKSLSELDADDELNDRYKGSIRYDSVFGWPFFPEAGPDDYEFSEYVYFTVPFEDCVVSSYTYLDAFQYDWISLDEYDRSFCFDPQEFLSVCYETGRPYSPNELLYFETVSKEDWVNIFEVGVQ